MLNYKCISYGELYKELYSPKKGDDILGGVVFS